MNISQKSKENNVIFPDDQLLTIHWQIFDCLLSEPGLMPQSLFSEVSDKRPAHLDVVNNYNLSYQYCNPEQDSKLGPNA